MWITQYFNSPIITNRSFLKVLILLKGPKATFSTVSRVSAIIFNILSLVWVTSVVEYQCQNGWTLAYWQSANQTLTPAEIIGPLLNPCPVSSTFHTVTLTTVESISHWSLDKCWLLIEMTRYLIWPQPVQQIQLIPSELCFSLLFLMSKDHPHHTQILCASEAWFWRIKSSITTLPSVTIVSLVSGSCVSDRNEAYLS